MSRDTAALFHRCAAMLRQGSQEAAALLPLLEAHPGFAPGWVEIGTALLPTHPPAALVAFSRAVPADPALARAHLGQGLCLRRSGDHAGAEQALTRATGLAPTLAPAWFHLGLVRQDREDADGAVIAYRAALAADAMLHEAAFNLGVLLQDRRDMEAALDAYATALRARPAALGRIAHALSSASTGLLWLRLEGLREVLLARPRRARP